MASKAKENVELTKYELARILGSRALQLSMGAPMRVKLTKKQLEDICYNPLEIAKLELGAAEIPIEVVRDEKKA